MKSSRKPFIYIICIVTVLCVSVSAFVERNKVILSLGSNTGDKKAILDSALKALNALGGVKVLNVSDYIETQPYGGVADGLFLNCAALIDCILPPRALLNEIHRIEAEHGRTREKRWGNRTLDIDIVFFGNKIIAEEGLCVPHSDYNNRAFVLEPVKQIAPDFVCPVSLKRMSDF
ncbi:MAG: 2-amino-4-hydroxy-6-hydroxymethyldihydropteridine diphosphokinase [Clostridia bacterium]|nr:2-amino-4-hydroxy-6-hydroxymethyldihydropteridine diphosphokinase [Clostridia bacterium]